MADIHEDPDTGTVTITFTVTEARAVETAVWVLANRHENMKGDYLSAGLTDAASRSLSRARVLWGALRKVNVAIGERYAN